MHRSPDDEMRAAQRARPVGDELDGPTLARLRTRSLESFREQISFGVPSNEAEHALKALAADLRAGRVRVRFYPRRLHAKLYLAFRKDAAVPRVGFLGSSNLSHGGLTGQGELNIDVTDVDSTGKLATWFDDRWNEATDLTDELAALLETSWATADHVSPYLVYLRIAYHLSEEARAGDQAFPIPDDLKPVLLDFQARAVAHAAYHLQRRGGVLLGDVVGLGKTITSIATARLFQEEGSRTLVICPPKLKGMWERESRTYNLYSEVVSFAEAINVLPTLGTWQTLIIDESHNLRNREGKRYAAIRDYVERVSPRVMLLSATPYNKQYEDLAAQLRLFVDETTDLRVRPERFFSDLRAKGKDERHFAAQAQASPRSLKAFESSPHADDWRDLMRLFLVRRTRSYILRNFATFDPERDRHFMMMAGERSYFPIRQPHTVAFAVDPDDPADPYAQLLRPDVVDVIGNLTLPRYGLAGYLDDRAVKRASAGETALIKKISRAGKRLIGFTKTGLFKRLESSGESFLMSIERHVLRNLVFVHALEAGEPIPIGNLDPSALDPAVEDEDEDLFVAPTEVALSLPERAARAYSLYRSGAAGRFQWLDARFFHPALVERLRADADALQGVLTRAGYWEPEDDRKLDALYTLLTETHAADKVLVFTQFADTARYLARELAARGVEDVGLATGGAADPTALARRFSPTTNDGLRLGETPLRVLIATDVLSEGQNLQDAHVVVNYDLPWAIIRLIQRAGRVDRIGQQHDTVQVYSFLPASGVETQISLRSRLAKRLKENQEVIGTDEAFFGDEEAGQLRDLYAERPDVLDDDDDDDVDLASVALQVWNSAEERYRTAALALPPVVAAARPATVPGRPPDDPGVVAYLRYEDGADALLRLDRDGAVASQSLGGVFRSLACAPDTPAAERDADHHDLVAKAVARASDDRQATGALGSLREVRRRAFDRLQRHRDSIARAPLSLFDPDAPQRLARALDALYLGPLKDRARDAIGRALRTDAPPEALADLVLQLHDDGALSRDDAATADTPEPHVVCSLGFVASPALT